MNFPKILLASKSPRRHEILSLSGFDFEVVNIEADEDFPSSLKGPEICCFLSEHKSNHYAHPIENNQLLVTADTIVWIENEVLNKPADAHEAKEMLQKLNGKTHTVYTGVTIRTASKTHTFFDETQVTFYPLSDSELDNYIQNCRPFDKAGSYGIQDWMGLVGVKSINGCFYNVMGFPAAKFYRELQQFI